MQYYPIFLNLSVHSCLVIGGGMVAERKVESLLQAHGQVTVVSPTLTPRLRSWAADQAITVHERFYHPGDLKGFTLVFAATDDEVLHQQIAAEAREAGVFLNVVDRPALCSFIVPAIVSQGDLTLAISTGGASPALAKKIRLTLEQSFGPEYDLALRLLARVREHVARYGLSADERQRLFTALVDAPLLDYLRERQLDKLNALLRQTAGETCTLEGLGFSF
ncbi:MAG: bifunctional precorrin-2 dehydrogenase/sirohydrochlorin ferrochelatase [Deltaproteobacteria bacterium]|nr:bifunctional precorrin-2 dehydrogenase/sirohydrochlorin ferrochelatase [Deltaproteobacteria bacterium]